MQATQRPVSPNAPARLWLPSLRYGPLRYGALAVLLTAAWMPAQGGESQVEATRATLEKWVEARRVISKEKRDWVEGKASLVDRIDLVKREIGSLQTRIDDAQTSITEAGEKKGELVEKNEELKASSASLVDKIAALEARTVKLLPRLPQPLQERVKPLSQRIPEKPGETELSLSERFMNVVGLLNAVNKFNREVSVFSERRTLENGSTAEVSTLYVGIGQGYYVTNKGDAAGIGSATDEGWVWTPANHAAADIQKAIAIYRNEEAADFIRLPVRIR